MFLRISPDPAEALFKQLGLDAVLERVARTMARTGVCPLSGNEELDDGSIKARANLAAERREALRRFSRSFQRPLSAIEAARVDPAEPKVIAEGAVGDVLARGLSYSGDDEALRRKIRVLEVELDGIEQSGEGRRSVRVVNLGRLGLGTSALAVVEAAASATFLFGSGYPGGWIGTGSIAAIYGMGNTLGAYLLGDHLMRRSAGWVGTLARIAGACLLIPAVALLNGAFGLLRLAGGEGLDGIESGLRLINIERLDVALVRFDVVGVVLLGPALFGWMTAKWRQARNPNPEIDRIERALEKLAKACRELRDEFEEEVGDRVGQAHADLDAAQDEMEAGLAAAKRALLEMGAALSDFTGDESVRLAAHEGAVNLFRARLAARVNGGLLPEWVRRPADLSCDMPNMELAEELRRKVAALDQLVGQFRPALAAARDKIQRAQLLALGLGADPFDGLDGLRLPAPALAAEAAERLQYQLERPLHHPVPDRGNREDADLAAILRNFPPPCRQRHIGAPHELVPDLLKGSDEDLSISADLGPACGRVAPPLRSRGCVVHLWQRVRRWRWRSAAGLAPERGSGGAGAGAQLRGTGAGSRIRGGCLGSADQPIAGCGHRWIGEALSR
jgi:hypothetical protein